MATTSGIHLRMRIKVANSEDAVDVGGTIAPQSLTDGHWHGPVNIVIGYGIARAQVK